jgi:Family of unknown function (DUF5719)
MKRTVAVLVTLTLSFMCASLLNQTTSGSLYSESYPAVVCPPTLSGLTSQISTPKTTFQLLANRSAKTNVFKSYRYVISQDALIVSANGVTPIIWQTRAGKWAGGTICSGPTSSQWFVGGSSDVTSRGQLIVTNSGLSDALVDVQVFSEKGKQKLTSLTIKAKSYSTLALDALATGNKILTVHVIPRSGRINAFMIDERGTGLTSMGGDFVNSVSAPSTTLVIPAIPNQLVNKSLKAATSHIVRIMNTSAVNANFTLELQSTDGNFIPTGFDSRNIAPGVVTELQLSPIVAASAFAIRITSDQPVVAAISSVVITKTGKDLVWSTPTPPLAPMTMAISGLTPAIVFTSPAISVQIEVAFLSGKKSRVIVKGVDVTAWHVPNGARTIRIIKSSIDTYAGALTSDGNGYGYIPIAPGSLLTRVEVPRSNIRVLNP